MVSNGRFWRCGLPITFCLSITSKEMISIIQVYTCMCNRLGCAAGTAYMSKLHHIADRSAAELCKIVGSVAQSALQATKPTDSDC